MKNIRAVLVALLLALTFGAVSAAPAQADAPGEPVCTAQTTSGWSVEPPTGERWDLSEYQTATDWTILKSKTVPAEGYWTEAQPAQGEPTIWIDNPAYVPESTVDHPAVTHIEWKYSRHGDYGFVWVDNDTFKYVLDDGTGTDHKPSKGVIYYERTQNKQTVVDTPAWTETIHAQGDPQIEVENPDYKPAVESKWVETKAAYEKHKWTRQVCEDTVWVWWALAPGSTEDSPWAGGDQTYSPNGAVECGTTYQVDRYPVSQVGSLTADGVLTEGEDYEIALDWYFETTDACPIEATPVLPDPTLPTCDEDGSLPDKPDTEGVVYSWSEDGLTLNAEPAEGYKFAEGEVTSRTYEQPGKATGYQSDDPDAPCYTEPEEPTEPPTTPEEPTEPSTTPEEPTEPPTTPEEPTTPVTPDEPTEPPTTPATPDEPTTTPETGPPAYAQRMPETGADYLPWVAGALGASVIGAALVLIARHRRATN